MARQRFLHHSFLHFIQRFGQLFRLGRDVLQDAGLEIKTARNHRRKQLRGNSGPGGRKRHQALDFVFELAHVAGPVVMLQEVKGAGRKRDASLSACAK